MKRIIFCFIILFSFSTIAYAQDQDNPGQYEMNKAFIFIYNGEPYWCAAYPDYPNQTDGVIGNQTEEPINIKFISVVRNQFEVKAICKFTNETYPFNTKALVGQIIPGGCTLQIDGCTCEGGDGFVTAAATVNAYYDSDLDRWIGGSAMLNCTFDAYECGCGD